MIIRRYTFLKKKKRKGYDYRKPIGYLIISPIKILRGVPSEGGIRESKRIVVPEEDTRYKRAKRNKTETGGTRTNV